MQYIEERRNEYYLDLALSQKEKNERKIDIEFQNTKNESDMEKNNLEKSNVLQGTINEINLKRDNICQRRNLKE